MRIEKWFGIVKEFQVPIRDVGAIVGDAGHMPVIPTLSAFNVYMRCWWPWAFPPLPLPFIRHFLIA